jgi:dTMP kinase
VTVEGIEASGKSTLLAGVAQRLRSAGVEPVVTREPGGTAIGERLRAVLLDAPGPLDPMTELFVVCAARAEHARALIGPALHSGGIVLCDRFADATRAYQGGGRGIDDATIVACSALAARGVQPDLTLLVDVPLELSRARVAARAVASGVPRDRMEREDDAFHARVRDRYLAIADAEPERVLVVDGSLDPGAVLARAWPRVAAAAGLS